MKSDLSIIQKLTRLYTFNSPIRKGKYRLAEASLALEGELPKQIVAKTIDGRTLRVNFDNHFAHFIYFLGEYEPAITNIIKKLVKSGDICFDIGGNIGWFTTLFQSLVGETGKVHSFEPVPPTFEILQENVGANLNSNAVVLNNFALGEEEGEVNLHIFDHLPDGHASMADFGESNFTVYPSKIYTVNSYLAKNEIKDVKFVKVDIEGAELSMLKGATDFFKQETPPLFEIEMALDTTKGFGYLPDDIIRFMKSQHDFRFFALDDIEGKLLEIKGFAPDDRGANVLCIPHGRFAECSEILEISRG